MKRLVSLALLIAVMVSICSCTYLPDQEDSDNNLSDSVISREDSVLSEDKNLITPLLYKVSCSKGGELYLLGSIHVGDYRVDKMPSYIMDAYQASRYIAVEADIVAYENDMAKQIKCTQKMLCGNGKTIKDYLGNEIYEKAKQFLQGRDAYNNMYDLYGPAMWNSLIDNELIAMTELDTMRGIDRLFINKANEDNKPIREIESIEFQYDMLLSFSDETYQLLINSAVEETEESLTATRELYETWICGDESEMWEAMRDDTSNMTEEELEIYKDYINVMLTDRNVGMADKAEIYLAEGATGFYIVGAAHVVGDGGLVELLRERGYNVSIVNAD